MFNDSLKLDKTQVSQTAGLGKERETLHFRSVSRCYSIASVYLNKKLCIATEIEFASLKQIVCLNEIDNFVIKITLLQFEINI